MSSSRLGRILGLYGTKGTRGAGTIFQIIGAGRGGTSLLASLIDSHPDCSVVFEELSTNTLRPDTSAVDLAQDAIAPRTARRLAAYRKACLDRAATSRERVWGHKITTEHIRALSKPVVAESPSVTLEREFAIATRDWPTVFITRDARTCVPSKMRRTGQSLEAAIDKWRFSVRVLEALKAHGGRLKIVAMEDLVRVPERTLSEICAFLGVPFDARVIDGTDNAKMLPDYRRSGLDPSTVTITENPDWVDQVRPELLYLGYAVDPRRD